MTIRRMAHRHKEQSIESKILFLRGEKVILDRDLAELYGVTTKRLNEQVKRNRARFPRDFMFQLNKLEKDKVVAKCDHLKIIKFSSKNPYVFTEHGAVMMANVLKSRIAIQVSIRIVRAFVRLRQILASNEDLTRRLNHLEKRYDHQFKVVFDTLRELLSPPVKLKPKIGFHP